MHAFPQYYKHLIKNSQTIITFKRGLFVLAAFSTFGATHSIVSRSESRGRFTDCFSLPITTQGVARAWT